MYTGISMKQGFQDIFYVPDYNNTIRKVTVNGVVTTLSTPLSTPLTLTFGPDKLLYLNNNLYITSPDNNILKKLVLSTGLVTDIAKGFRGSIATDGIYIYVASNDYKVYQIKLDGDFPDTSPSTNSRVFAGIDTSGSTNGAATTVAQFSNLLNIICIGNNLYVADGYPGNKIRKIPINSDGTAGNVSTLVTVTGGSNYGGITNIGNTIYYGSDSNIYKIIIDDNGNFISSNILLDTGGGTFSSSLVMPRSRLTNDGVNLYCTKDMNTTEIFKIPINSDGIAGTIVSFVGSNTAGTTDGTGSAARFNFIEDLTGVFEPFAGKNNIAIGEKALYSNTIGEGNVALGYQAGDVITTGDSNVIIGYGANVNSSNAFNQIVIGAGTTGTGNNEIALGNTSITAIKGQVAFSTYSDIRIKKNITNSDLGLDFIKQLRPVKYNKVNPAEYPDEILEKRFKGDDPDEKPEDDLQVYHGLVAQEVKQVLDNASKTWDGHSINESNGKQGIAYGALTVPLIKAVQELSEENTQLKADIAAIKSHLGI